MRVTSFPFLFQNQNDTSYFEDQQFMLEDSFEHQAGSILGGIKSVQWTEIGHQLQKSKNSVLIYVE